MRSRTTGKIVRHVDAQYFELVWKFPLLEPLQKLKYITKKAKATKKTKRIFVLLTLNMLFF